MRKEIVYKPDGSKMIPFDLCIGEVVNIRGREISIVRVDDFTRRFFDHNEYPLHDNIEMPKDKFISKVEFLKDFN